MSPDGSNQRPVTDNPQVKYNAGWPQWIPAGSRTLDLLADAEQQARVGVFTLDDRVPAWPDHIPLTFENPRAGSVRVCWMSSLLSEQLQFEVGPGAKQGVTTLPGHRFRFRDSATGFVTQEDHLAEASVALQALV